MRGRSETAQQGCPSEVIAEGTLNWLRAGLLLSKGQKGRTQRNPRDLHKLWSPSSLKHQPQRASPWKPAVQDPK